VGVKDLLLAVTMDQISVGEEHAFCSNDCFAIVDSGMSLIGGPGRIVNQINTLLGGRRAEWGEYELNCQRVPNLPPLVIQFGGQVRSIHTNHPVPLSLGLSFGPGEVRAAAAGRGRPADMPVSLHDLGLRVDRQ